jgi:hypothetical protein
MIEEGSTMYIRNIIEVYFDHFARISKINRIIIVTIDLLIFYEVLILCIRILFILTHSQSSIILSWIYPLDLNFIKPFR